MIMAMDIKVRLAKGNKCYYALNNVIKSKKISRSAKLDIYRTITRPIVINASETWRLRKLEEKMIIMWERKILRRIFGPKKEDGIWKIRTNKELAELYNNPDIVAKIRSRRIAWLGHLIRMDQGQMVKNYFMANWEEDRQTQTEVAR
jgi:hypothetical protein